jgi:hypothetical protein
MTFAPSGVGLSDEDPFDSKFPRVLVTISKA